jgi:hypothetical protein
VGDADPAQRLGTFQELSDDWVAEAARELVEVGGIICGLAVAGPTQRDKPPSALDREDDPAAPRWIFRVDLHADQGEADLRTGAL